MTKISAQIVADSSALIGYNRRRITTMLVVMPRYILAEFNTHRMFSRNSASSRAIPFNKMMDSIKHHPFVPMAFMKDHPGMQGTEYFTGQDHIIRRNKWCDNRWKAMTDAIDLHDLGVTKQLVNRPIEAYMWHTVIVTATEWENFFELRCPKFIMPKRVEGSPDINMEFRSRKDALKFCIEEYGEENCSEFKENFHNWLFWRNTGQADIHMMATAEAMWDAYNESKPEELKEGEWHTPFKDKIDWTHIQETLPHVNNMDRDEVARKVATAMLARVSYTSVGEEKAMPSYDKLIDLHDRLAKSGHWSPFEHCARVMTVQEFNTCKFTEIVKIDANDYVMYKETPGVSGNFHGFIQYRKTFMNENIEAIVR